MISKIIPRRTKKKGGGGGKRMEERGRERKEEGYRRKRGERGDFSSFVYAIRKFFRLTHKSHYFQRAK